MSGIEVVRRGQDVLVGPHVQAVVEQAEAHRGAVGQGDVCWRYGQVGARRAEHVRLQPRLVLVQVVHRVVVEPAAVRVDGIADWRRVGGEQRFLLVEQLENADKIASRPTSDTRNTRLSFLKHLNDLIAIAEQVVKPVRVRGNMLKHIRESDRGVREIRPAGCL